ncbi:lymphocyte antigen 6e-like [Limosa lapponica baueri]|uniref:Lymphocyte antigen 6e-like n=1 Tax=Limosa lapponica baueri TaxID=1758121 RepID=A0A2I0TLQ1_LIMLA|nr:lymphocyte antigen 6e-like [Limosa lapponica baueri]
MKASLLAVLVLILCAVQANALYCYTCEWEQSNWSCLKAKKCSDKDEYCVTNVASVGIGSEGTATMKAVLIALLVAVLCARQGKELWKLGEPDGEDENTRREIRDNTGRRSCPFLSILHLGKDMGYRITKKCSADCPEANVNFGVAAYSTKCCKTSLCNFSGANSIKISYGVMLLGIVASMICVIRAGFTWKSSPGCLSLLTQWHPATQDRQSQMLCLITQH